MLYAILCYNAEDEVSAWTKPQHDKVMAGLAAVQKKLAAKGKIGPVARLLPTTAATSLRKGQEPLVIDGPFVETKEQLLGFYVVDFDSLEEALETVRELAQANPGAGGYEIRPIAEFHPAGRTA